jgi:uncharacterized membrane protein (DUF4010 family)
VISSFSLLVSDSSIFGLCVALGIGLLVGAERERRKGAGPTRAAAGVRTFAVTATLGAVGMLLGGSIVLAVVALVVGMLAVVAYQRSREDDPGMTTEIALLLTCLLGGLAVQAPALAAGIGAGLALLLAARNRIHYFVRGVLTERELHDAVLFAAAALIVLPLSPDRFIGPFDAINLYSIARLVVLMMAIGGLGHISMRALGPSFGLPVAGFAAGFISSIATVYLMGERAKKNPRQMSGAVAGAILSSLATIIQMAVVIALVQPSLLNILFFPLSCGGLVAGVYSLFFIFNKSTISNALQSENMGRAFDLKLAFIFAAIVSSILLVSTALSAWFGLRGTLFAAALSGLVDAHATAASVATLVATNKLLVEEAVLAILAGLTTNTLMKAAVAYKAGGVQYLVRILPGLFLAICSIWLSLWLV